MKRAARAAKKSMDTIDEVPAKLKKQAMKTPRNMEFDPTTLACMLEDLKKDLPNVAGNEGVTLELKGFDINDVKTFEEFVRLRDEIKVKTGNNFDENGRTALNVDAAAIAGAKMVVDKSRSTRSFSKKLMESSGVSEDDILYKGLPADLSEAKAAKSMNDTRKASLIESLVDFQKQIQFKMNVLKHMENEVAPKRALREKISMSDGRVTRGGAASKAAAAKKGGKRGAAGKGKSEFVMKTPVHRHDLNPLDDKRIYDEYASNIASELREEQKKRRRTAPIPFNLNLLDDDED